MQHLTDSSNVIDRPRATQDGQATVEFALVLPVLVLLVFGALELGTAFWHYQQVSSAASEGARKAAVSRTLSDRDARIRQTVIDAAPALQSSSVGVATNSTWTAGDPVTVTVSYPERISVMGITFFNANLVSRRTTRVEH